MSDSRFNPRSPCGERRARYVPIFGRVGVSTHAPLAGSDTGITSLLTLIKFQPTLPLRGATIFPYVDVRQMRFQPTLPLRGATLARVPPPPRRSIVSTHAPLAGSDYTLLGIDALTQFQPTLPLRGATAQILDAPHDIAVSTHAPLAGSDGLRPTKSPVASWFQPTLPLRGATWVRRIRRLPQQRFNPRSPCGERQST